MFFIFGICTGGCNRCRLPFKGSKPSFLVVVNSGKTFAGHPGLVVLVVRFGLVDKSVRGADIEIIVRFSAAGVLART